jgi:hypothetical protein
MTWLLDLIKKLRTDNFYGTLILKFEAGRIVHGERRESFKPPKQ